MHIIGALVIVILVLVVDQLVKHWAMVSLASQGSIPLIDGVFHLTYAENRGAAFSILQGQRWIFVAVTLVAVGVMLYALIKKIIEGCWNQIALSFLIGGALGNLVDRIRQGFVVDMFEFRFINFAIFNVADTFLTIGVSMMIVSILILDRHKNREEKGEEKDGKDMP